jgi:hypothetical protein
LKLGQLLWKLTNWLHGGIVTIGKIKSLFTPQEVSELHLFVKSGLASLTSEGNFYKSSEYFSRLTIQKSSSSYQAKLKTGDVGFYIRLRNYRRLILLLYYYAAKCFGRMTIFR